MKNVPIIFPLLFLAIIFTTFFSGAYAIAESAVRGPGGETVQRLDANRPAGDSSDQSSLHSEW